MAMELASSWCAHFKNFCARLDSSCGQLRRDMEEHPPLQAGDNFSCFVDKMKEAVWSLTSQVESLEAMTSKNVSFEEMFGNCLELHKQNEAGIVALEAQLGLYGYSADKGRAASVVVPATLLLAVQHVQLGPPEASGNSEVADEGRSNVWSTGGGEAPCGAAASASGNRAADAFLVHDDDDPIFAESFSLRHIGLSSAALATIADHENSADMPAGGPQAAAEEDTARTVMRGAAGEQEDDKPTSANDGRDGNAPVATQGTLVQKKSVLAEVSEEEFKRAPAFLKSRFPLKDLNHTIVKLNELLCDKLDMDGEELSILPTDFDLLALGPKTKECLLLLVRLDRLSIQRSGDSTLYRPCCKA